MSSNTGMLPCDREGSFKARITGYGLKEFESGAVSVSLKADLLEFWDGTQWQPWADYSMEAEGDVCIVKKDKTINQGAAESLINFAGWDGDIVSIGTEAWHPTNCVLVVKADTYKDQTRYRIAFVNDYNRTPGGMSNVDAAKVKELQARFGSQFRALAGNKQRNGTPPANRPAPPPPVSRTPPNELASAHTDDRGNPLPF